MICFISGHIDITHDEFLMRYSSKIDSAISQGHSFVVGDANGTDLFAQQYLALRVPREKVTVYHMGDKPKNNAGNFKTKGKFRTHDHKDSQMTLDSNYDVLWVRSNEESMALYGSKFRPDRVSGTEKNRLRRLHIKKAGA